ncbi:hypothetical protein ACFL6U_00775 [Planctomycetota bacterium]
MNKHKELRKALLKADGADSQGISTSERAAFQQLLDRALPEPSKWRRIMSAKITRCSVAAAVVVIVALSFLGISPDGSSIVFADIVEQMRLFRPYRCRYTVIEKDAQKRKSYVFERNSPEQRRETYSNGLIYVLDLSISKELQLDPNTDLAREHWLDVAYGDMGNRDFDLMAHVERMLDHPREDLGTKTLEGKTAQGFRQSDTYNDLTLWADVETKLPVVFQIIHVNTGKKIVFDQFEFDVTFPEDHFSTVAPPGYKVRKTGKGYTDPEKVGQGLSEEPLLTGLKAVAEFLDGEFPLGLGVGQVKQAVRQYAEEHNLTEEEEDDRILPLVNVITKMVFYLRDLRHGPDMKTSKVKDFQYRGSGVKLGDSETPILWWQYNDATTYRVIYGDLSIRDVAVEDLPQ